MPKVGIVMGSDSDMKVMGKAADMLEKFGIDYEMTIISAHREPDVFYEYAKSAEAKDFKVIIAGAGMAAHLPGMCAAIFPMPVIGIPMSGKNLEGVDALYSIVQMPPGIPVATVAIDGGANAAILAAKDNRVFLKQEDIKKAFVKVGIGAEKKSKVISEKEKRITAFHEAGHAILFHVLPDVGPVYSVSIIPTGSAGGYTMPLPEKDEMFNTKGKMLQDIMTLLGGRIAEEIIFGDITTGASNDIKRATATARSMVMKYGMSDKLGLICYGDDDDEVFIGRDLAHTRSYSEDVAKSIDEEIRRIISECHDQAKKIILEHEDVLHKCASLLLEKEKVHRDEFEALFITENPETENNSI